MRADSSISMGMPRIKLVNSQTVKDIANAEWARIGPRYVPVKPRKLSIMYSGMRIVMGGTSLPNSRKLDTYSPTLDLNSLNPYAVRVANRMVITVTDTEITIELIK